MLDDVRRISSFGLLSCVLAACGGDGPKGNGAGSGGTSGNPGSAGTGAASGKGGTSAGGSSAGGSSSGGTGNAGTAGSGGGTGGAAVTTIGPSGGEVSIDGASVTIPAGSLAADQPIGVAEVAAPLPVPEGFTARSAVYAFTPHGLTFTIPVTLSLDYTGTADTVLRLDDELDTTWEEAAAPSFADGAATVSTSSFSYYVVAQAAGGSSVVGPLYPTAPNWNDHVKNDGPDRFHSTGTACSNQWWNTPQLAYRECIHAGEHRAVSVTGRASCAGLTATDSLGAFDWTCEVLAGTATMVSTGFRPDAALSTVLDFSAGGWRTNSVTVSDGAGVVLTTPQEVWWNNPVEIDNDGMSSSTAGTIYLVTQDTEAPYELSADGSALVVRPGYQLTGPATVSNSSRVKLGGFGSYFEGRMTGTGIAGLHLAGSQFYIRNVRISGFDLAIQSAWRSRVENAAITCLDTGSGTGINFTSGNMIRNVKTAKCASGLSSGASVILNVVEDVFISGGGFSISGSNHVVAGMTTHHSGSVGIGIGLGEGVLLMHATTAHNLTYGFSSYNFAGTVPRQVIGMLSTENRLAGIALDYNAVMKNVGSFANTHWGVYFEPLGTDGNVFNGAFSTGYNGDDEINYYVADLDGCYNDAFQSPGDCVNSRPDTSSGSPNGLLSLPDGTCDDDTNSNITSPFNPPLRGTDHPFPVRIKLQDDVNGSNGPDGTAAHADITDWLDFENFYRGWGSEGPASPSCASQGPCSETSTGTAGCQIYDYRLRYDAAAFIADAAPYPTGNATFTHVFAADGGSYDGLSEALCSAWFEHSVFDPVAYTCTVTFLADAREILGDMRGNDNLLCESDEVCLWTPNIASYQGEGALRAPPGHTFQDGTIQNVTLLEYETNGTTLPHSP